MFLTMRIAAIVQLVFIVLQNEMYLFGDSYQSSFRKIFAPLCWGIVIAVAIFAVTVLVEAFASYYSQDNKGGSSNGK
jgi:hypothetical protein